MNPDAPDLKEKNAGNLQSPSAGQEKTATTQEFTLEEFAFLTTLAHKPERHWWQNYPFLVSLLAFVLSLATTFVSIYTGHRKDVNDRLAQLSSAIQTIQDLNLKQVEVYEKYKGTRYENQANALITTQLNNTLRMATKLAFSLGPNASTAALASVAQGLYGLGDIEASQKLFELGLTAASSAADESISLRSLGFIKIRNGSSGQSLQEGEELFLRAVNLERKYVALSPETVLWLKVMAHGQWASALAPTNCDEARKHFAESVNLLKTPLDNLDLAQLRNATQAQIANGIGGVMTCKM